MCTTVVFISNVRIKKRAKIRAIIGTANETIGFIGYFLCNVLLSIGSERIQAVRVRLRLRRHMYNVSKI